jgi:hypothetical protein
MQGHDPEGLPASPLGTGDSPESLETRFRRVYGRDMTPEESKYFALVEHLFRFQPEGGAEATKTQEPKRSDDAPTTGGEKSDGSDSDSPKAA